MSIYRARLRNTSNALNRNVFSCGLNWIGSCTWYAHAVSNVSSHLYYNISASCICILQHVMMIAYPRSAYSAIIEICSIDNSVQLSRVFLGKFFIYGEFSEVMILRKNALEWYLHSKEKIW